jgi:hypothetical protein
VNDIHDAASFPVIVQAAQPVIATLKGLNARLTDQRTNQNKIDKILNGTHAFLPPFSLFSDFFSFLLLFCRSEISESVLTSQGSPM